jgi:alanyl-tRNA synthetase
MFYWSDNKNTAPKKFNPNDKKWIEIGNDVLMEYEKIGPKKYVPAKQKNIDNGTGLERLLAVMNGLDDNYQTDLFWPSIKKIEELSKKEYIGQTKHVGSRLSLEPTQRSMRIIADHLRAATFIMGDDFGVAPANVDQGYVVRKLIRRAIRHGHMIGIQNNFTHQIAGVVINLMSEIYPELKRNKKFVIDNLLVEEEKFNRTLQQGLKKFHKNIKTLKHENKRINGKMVFDLFQSYGFPLELTQELAQENGLMVDEAGFNEEFKKHQELSRTASSGKFKGGLAGQTEMTLKYHTATHLLLAALREVLGSHVFQKGSNITDERLRLDFSHYKKIKPDEITRVTKMINDWIKQSLEVKCQEMETKKAKEIGMGVFTHKYGERVKVYLIGEQKNPISCEICGGPHVKSTGELGRFKIIKEEAVSAGVRRIKAVLE